MKAFLEYIPLLFFLVFYKLDPRPLSLGGFDFSVGGIYSATAVLMLSTVVLYGALWFKEGKLTRMQWLVVGAVVHAVTVVAVVVAAMVVAVAAAVALAVVVVDMGAAVVAVRSAADRLYFEPASALVH